MRLIRNRWFEARSDGATYLKFGKHAGTTLQELLDTDPRYLNYMLEKFEDLPPAIVEFIEEAIETGDDPLSDAPALPKDRAAERLAELKTKAKHVVKKEAEVKEKEKVAEVLKARKEDAEW